MSGACASASSSALTDRRDGIWAIRVETCVLFFFIPSGQTSCLWTVCNHIRHHHKHFLKHKPFWNKNHTRPFFFCSKPEWNFPGESNSVICPKGQTIGATLQTRSSSISAGAKDKHCFMFFFKVTGRTSCTNLPLSPMRCFWSHGIPAWFWNTPYSIMLRIWLSANCRTRLISNEEATLDFS